MKSVILVLIALVAWAADPVQSLPPDAAKIQAEHDATVAKLKAAYDTGVAKADQDAAKKMEPVVTKLTKAGDLKGAIATQAVLDGWKASSSDLLAETKPSKPEEKIHPTYPVAKVDASSQGELQPRFAIDGNPQSRWQATAINGQWLTVSFYKIMNIKTMTIKWEKSFAKSYNVEVNIGGTWQRVAEKKLGAGGTEVISIGKAGVTAIKICDMVGTEWPPSIFEITLE
jgi:hypothetical protein